MMDGLEDPRVVYILWSCTAIQHFLDGCVRYALYVFYSC